jgi:hypothetical protein
MRLKGRLASENVSWAEQPALGSGPAAGPSDRPRPLRRDVRLFADALGRVSRRIENSACFNAVERWLSGLSGAADGISLHPDRSFRRERRGPHFGH